MTGPPTSYFKYFPASDEIRRWGLAVTAAGCTRFDRNASYPHPGHPVDHQFDWRRGRRLERTAGLSVAAAWHRPQSSQPARDHLNQVILEAERRLVYKLEESIDLLQMARALGLSYSHLIFAALYANKLDMRLGNF
jgi:hypothetical protein